MRNVGCTAISPLCYFILKLIANLTSWQVVCGGGAKGQRQSNFESIFLITFTVSSLIGTVKIMLVLKVEERKVLKYFLLCSFKFLELQNWQNLIFIFMSLKSFSSQEECEWHNWVKVFQPRLIYSFRFTASVLHVWIAKCDSRVFVIANQRKEGENVIWV